MNDKPFKKREGTRRSAYLEEESAFMNSLPPTPYEPATWTGEMKVGADYLISDGKNRYSVPFDLIGEKGVAKLTKNVMAMTMIRDVLKETGITATVGIGTNLYLAKVCMDTIAKKAAPDKDGVRIAELNEDSYKFLLWDHRPLTDFWMLGPEKAHTLERAYLFTMGDIAQKSQYDEEWFYKKFGIDGEILIAHAWGIDPVTMADIKNYHSDGHSLSNGQVLPRPYKYGEARTVSQEMIDCLCTDMFAKGVVAPKFTWWVSYDYKSLKVCPGYEGERVLDFYGRLHPKHNNGTVKMPMDTNSISTVAPLLLTSFDKKTDHRLLYRRLGVCAEGVRIDSGFFQLKLKLRSS